MIKSHVKCNTVGVSRADDGATQAGSGGNAASAVASKMDQSSAIQTDLSADTAVHMDR